MKDFVKKFFEREFAEIKKNKFRIGALIFFAAIGLIFLFGNFESEEKILDAENENIEVKKISETEKVPDKKNSDADKNSDTKKVPKENVTKIIGANSEPVFVKDPFKISENEETDSEVEKIEEEKNSEVEEKIFSPPAVVQNPSPQKNFPKPAEEEKFILSGSAISENQKTALIQHYRGKKFEETLFLKVGDILQGKRITEIDEDSITLSDGEKLYVN